MKERKLLFLSIAIVILLFFVVHHAGSNETYEEIGGEFAGTWYSEDPDDHGTYNIYEDGTYVYEGRYELEGSILSGVDTPGTYRVSLDGKKITLRDSEGFEDNKITGYLDEEGNLHLGSSIYHR